MIESNNEFETLPASEDIFQDQIQILNTEITAKKFEQQKAEFRLKGNIGLPLRIRIYIFQNSQRKKAKSKLTQKMKSLRWRPFKV